VNDDKDDDAYHDGIQDITGVHQNNIADNITGVHNENQDITGFHQNNINEENVTKRVMLKHKEMQKTDRT